MKVLKALGIVVLFCICFLLGMVLGSFLGEAMVYLVGDEFIANVLTLIIILVLLITIVYKNYIKHT